jgi:hypothetical protein
LEKAPLLKIYGERNTGTNYLQKLIKLNLDVNLLPGIPPYRIISTFNWISNKVSLFKRILPSEELVADIYFAFSFPLNLGWKHSLVKSVEQLRKYPICSENLTFITLTKNPYSWLLSFYRRPYHQYWILGLDFEAFLTSPLQTMRCENSPSTFKNPVELWNLKNASYIQLGKGFSTINLTYEALLSNPKATIEFIKQELRCQLRTQQFIDIEQSVKGDRKTSQDYKNYYLDRKWKKELTLNSISIINDFLDDEILEYFDYEKM